MADLTSRNIPMLPVRSRAGVDLLGEGGVAFLLSLVVLTCMLMPEPRAWGADLGDVKGSGPPPSKGPAPPPQRYVPVVPAMGK